MATLYRSYQNGTQASDIKPTSGMRFTLAELQRAVGGYVQIIRVPGRQKNLIAVNEDGKALNLPINILVLQWAREMKAIHPGDWIVGDAVIMRDYEFQ